MFSYEEYVKSLKPVKPLDLNPKNEVLTTDSHTPYLFQPYSPSENQCYIDQTLNYTPPTKPPIKKYKKKEYKWNTKIDTYNEGSVDNQGNYVTREFGTYWHVSDTKDYNEIEKKCDDDTKLEQNHSNKNKVCTNEYCNTKLNLQEMESGKLKNKAKNVYTSDEMVLKEELGELKNMYVKRVSDIFYVEYERLCKEVDNPFFSSKLDEFFDKINKENGVENNAKVNNIENFGETKAKIQEVKEQKNNDCDNGKEKIYRSKPYEKIAYKTNYTYKHERYNAKQSNYNEVESKFEKMYIRNQKILESKKNMESYNAAVDEKKVNIEKLDRKTYKNENCAEPKFTKYKKAYETDKEYKVHTKNVNHKKSEFDEYAIRIERCEKSAKYLEQHNYKTINVLANKIKGKQKNIAIKIIQQETKMNIIDCEDFLDIFLKECKMKVLSNVDLEGFETKKC